MQTSKATTPLIINSHSIGLRVSRGFMLPVVMVTWAAYHLVRTKGANLLGLRRSNPPQWLKVWMNGHHVRDLADNWRQSSLKRLPAFPQCKRSFLAHHDRYCGARDCGLSGELRKCRERA